MEIHDNEEEADGDDDDDDDNEEDGDGDDNDNASCNIRRFSQIYFLFREKAFDRSVLTGQAGNQAFSALISWGTQIQI